MSKYRDKKREMAGGISRLDLTSPAKIPKIKNKIDGSRKIFIVSPFCELS
jgi:hypothetical protein